jgi:hypothetical protein
MGVLQGEFRDFILREMRKVVHRKIAMAVPV